MSTTAITSEMAASCEALLPAVPTDTSSVLLKMLAMSAEVRRHRNENADRSVISRSVITMLLRALKLRDPAILLHSQRIAAIASGVARLLGWDDDQRRQLEVAALLHDLGKLGIPEHVLKKPGKLSSEEYDFVLLHHHAAVNLLQALHVAAPVINILAMQYHTFDGATVVAEMPALPQEIPLGARILAVADAYDSLNSPKPYRRGMTHAEVMSILDESSGTRYDGNVVRALSRWYENEGQTLFQHTDPFQALETKADLSVDDRNGIVVLTQILNTLYQFQQLYDGYFVVDAYENYCIWSDGMPGMTGLTLSSVLGRTWHPVDVQLTSVTDEAEAPDTREGTTMGQVLKNGRPQFASQLCQTSDTRHFKVDVYTIPVVGPNDHVYGAVQLLRNKSGVRRQSREYVELKLAATRDSLTGVANRGQLETQLRHMLEDFHAQEGTRPLSAIFLDVDKFKHINDTYGHHTGDAVLVDLTRLLQNETYSAEIIGRYGGEEFVLLCPDTELEAAVRRSERLRHSVMKSSVGGVTSLNVTASFGVSTARLGDTVQTLLERADNCLYLAKESGRNRTCWEGQDMEHADLEDIPEVIEPPAAPQVRDENGALQYTDQVEVSTSLEITAMKLHAFVREYNVEILSQEHGFIRFRIGSLGFTRRWGKDRDRQPLQIDLRFEALRIRSAPGAKPRTVRRVAITAVPFGKIKDREIFFIRCQGMMRDLRAFLLGT